MAGGGERLEPREEARRHRRRLRAPRQLRQGLGELTLARHEVGRSGADALGFGLARPLRRLSLALALDDRERSRLEVGLRLGDRLLAALDRAQGLGGGLLLLVDVRLEPRERALDLGEGRRPLLERGLALGDSILDALDRGRALLDVSLARREGRQQIVGVGRVLRRLQAPAALPA